MVRGRSPNRLRLTRATWVTLLLVLVTVSSIAVGIASQRASLAAWAAPASLEKVSTGDHLATPAPLGAPTVAGFATTVQSQISSSDPTPSNPSNPLDLSVAVAPSQICAYDSSDCPVGNPQARVTLQAAADVAPTPYWPNVQIAFVIETTAYDGVYYHYWGYPGTDPCADSDNRMGLPCEESNGVPFFMQNAGSIAAAIQENNPHSKVSFAMVDFFGTDCGDWDDCGDSYKYHVDISTFVPAADFGAAVTETLKDGVFAGGFSGVVGLDDNFLHSPSITALYGAIIGSGLTWSEGTHHVIVLMGSTAPRDPSYDEDYYVSPFDPCCAGSQALGWTCEPAYQFATGSSPNCEGWVHSQDGNPNDSIAALARTSPTCTDSVGHTCTIDVIDYWTTPTDPYSEGWPVHPAYNSGTQDGPGAPRVIENADHILEAGCDMAAATGGTWDGPSYWTCPNGDAGSLEYVPHGPYLKPNTNNPTLYQALRDIGFGPVYQTLVANGTKTPMFQYLPIGSVHVAPNPDFTASCSTPTGYLPTCQQVPTNLSVNGVPYLGWNWSTVAGTNAMYVGDTWTASFNIIANGPPFFEGVPVDACVTADCRAGSSGSVDGLFTSANYRTPAGTPGENGSTTVVQSFPLGVVTVEISATNGPPPTGPPPPPPTPPGIPVATPPALPVGNPVATINSVGVSNVSLQATAAGFLGAGFTQVSLKNRPIAMKVAAKSGAVTSKFDAGLKGSGGPGVGRFE